MSLESRAYVVASAVSQELRKRGYRGRVARTTSLIMIYAIGPDGRRVGRSIDHLLDTAPGDIAELLIQGLSTSTAPAPRRIEVEVNPNPDRRDPDPSGASRR